MSTTTKKQRPAKAAATPPQVLAKRRPVNELKFSLTIEVPDDDGGGRHQIDVDLRTMTLSERHIARRALDKCPQPPEPTDVFLIHAWVVWRRTHPTSSLTTWMETISFGDVLDAIDMNPEHTVWDTTPEGYDPNP